MQLQGKTALVTGGTDGIGAQLIRQLHAKGVTVITSGRDAGRVAATKADGFDVIQCDLSTLAGVEALVAGLGDRPIDILVNNAGAGVDHDFRVTPPDLAAADATIFLNLNAPIQLIARLLPMLRTRPEAMIVNVTSGLAIAPNTASAVYCATKAALRSYSQSLRAQLKDTRVHVLEALPPVVETKMTDRLTMKKLAPAECARQFIAAMEADAEEANVGQVKLLRLIHSISPAYARRFMLKF